jgi:hypothetical protein
LIASKDPTRRAASPTSTRESTRTARTPRRQIHSAANRSLCATVVVGALTFASVAHAGSRIVVVEDGDRTTREATARLRAELTAAGFEVQSRSARADRARDDVEQDGASAQGDGVASVRLVRDPSTHATELWVSDRLTGKTLVRRVSADPERAPRIVALRGVELLRASLLELASPPHDDAPPETPAMTKPPPPEVARLVAPTPVGAEAPAVPARSRAWMERAAVDAGVAMLASTDHLGPAAAPSVGAWLALPACFALRLRLVGPAFQSGLSNAAGTAVVSQELASVDLAWIAPVRGVVAPFVALGGGPYHLHVQGTATAPYKSASDDVWAALGAAGVGAALRLAPAVSIALEGRALALAPRPAVTLGGERVATAGGPSLLGSASLVASF